jgi:uncharacterized protein
MDKENKAVEFDAPDNFEWDERKNEINKDKHGIDFDEATEVFYEPLVLHQSDRNDEERWIATGYSNNRLITVVFAWRGDAIRIISARRARKNEERAYHHAQMGRPTQG